MEIEEGARHGGSNVGEQKQMLATILANMCILIAVVGWTMAASHMGIKSDILNDLLSVTVNVIGLLLSYSSCQYFGRKITLYLSITSFIIYWSLIPFVEGLVWAKVFFCLYVFGNSMCFFTAPLYVSEISCNSIRGTLGSIHMIFIFVGYGISEVMILYKGLTLQWAASIAIFFPLIAMIGMHWMPESPIFLVQKSRIDEASRCLLWLRDNDEGYVQNELLEIKEKLRRIPNLGSCLGDGIETLKDLVRVSANRRSLLIAVGLLLARLTIKAEGVPRLFSEIFCQPKDVRFHAASSLIPILGTVLVTILVDVVGRRRILLFSSAMKLIEPLMFYIFENFPITGMGNVNEGPICILACAFATAYFLGLCFIPYIIVLEVFQRKVLPLGYMISLVIDAIVSFMCSWINRTYISQMDRLGKDLSQFISRLCWTLFIYILVPETKGKVIE